MENPYTYYHNNQDPDDFDQRKSSKDRQQFIKKMIVLASSILSVPMVIFMIIFACIWHSMSVDFNQRHKDFQTASKQWDKDFWQRWNDFHASMEKDHENFEKNRKESEKQFHEIGKQMDQERDKDYTDEEWEAMEDDLAKKKFQEWEADGKKFELHHIDKSK